MMLDKLNKKTKRCSQILAWTGGAMIILSALLVTLEVILRKFFNFSFGGADEIAGYAFGIATSLSLSFALYERAHIRVDAFYNFMPRIIKVILDFISILLLVSFIAVVSYMAFLLLSDTIGSDSHSITPLRVPLSYPQTPWFFGWLACVVSGFILLITTVQALVRKDLALVQSLIGIKSTDELIDDEAVDQK
ncbi:TRAP transporter small permease [Kiloniella laminariae]|uniref:TRAP transporter small permease protein n=1 Tax=Kiloniella laminariae TaxID=454162 RepID=A0ABT4LNC5_9PROT|nr:TRAP transporter small permease [Kiloniella laminariae]MCZ4282587.1 TRAP transporter small permease [Kiloniella laminariae]